MRAVTRALLGGIVWRGQAGSIAMTQDADGLNAVLSATLAGPDLTFAYDHRIEAIAMREGALNGSVLHRFCNRTLVGDFEWTFSALWR